VERLAEIHGGDAASTLTGASPTTADPSEHRLSLGALRSATYRRYFVGQTVWVSGTWVQQTALSWLVLRLGGTGADVGLVVALQFLPFLFLGLLVPRGPGLRGDVADSPWPPLPTGVLAPRAG
jgi:hypothetical protein